APNVRGPPDAATAPAQLPQRGPVAGQRVRRYRRLGDAGARHGHQLLRRPGGPVRRLTSPTRGRGRRRGVHRARPRTPRRPAAGRRRRRRGPAPLRPTTPPPPPPPPPHPTPP